MRLLPLLTLLLFPASVVAEPLLYRMSDADSTVSVLGSVHALRTNDYPLPPPIEAAYENAERLVLEVDPAELRPAHMQSLLMPLALADDGRALKERLTQEEYARAQQELQSLGLDIRQFSQFEPWFVALQVFSFNLARLGYEASGGVDAHYAARAGQDNKTTTGLETAREQLRLFDTLPEETQVAFLLDTLEQSEDFRDEMQRLVELWRTGDVAGLESLIQQEFAEEPELREAMLNQRNRRWVPQIGALLDKPGDSLVIVGALHLVGDDGVIELLRDRGYDVERVEE